jgi:hypothetical protein
MLNWKNSYIELPVEFFKIRDLNPDHDLGHRLQNLGTLASICSCCCPLRDNDSQLLSLSFHIFSSFFSQFVPPFLLLVAPNPSVLRFSCKHWHQNQNTLTRFQQRYKVTCENMGINLDISSSIFLTNNGSLLLLSSSTV